MPHGLGTRRPRTALAARQDTHTTGGGVFSSRDVWRIVGERLASAEGEHPLEAMHSLEAPDPDPTPTLTMVPRVKPYTRRASACGDGCSEPRVRRAGHAFMTGGPPRLLTELYTRGVAGDVAT